MWQQRTSGLSECQCANNKAEQQGGDRRGRPAGGTNHGITPCSHYKNDSEEEWRLSDGQREASGNRILRFRPITPWADSKSDPASLTRAVPVRLASAAERFSAKPEFTADKKKKCRISFAEKHLHVPYSSWNASKMASQSRIPLDRAMCNCFNLWRNWLPATNRRRQSKQRESQMRFSRGSTGAVR